MPPLKVVITVLQHESAHMLELSVCQHILLSFMQAFWMSDIIGGRTVASLSWMKVLCYLQLNNPSLGLLWYKANWTHLNFFIAPNVMPKKEFANFKLVKIDLPRYSFKHLKTYKICLNFRCWPVIIFKARNYNNNKKFPIHCPNRFLSLSN